MDVLCLWEGVEFARLGDHFQGAFKVVVTEPSFGSRQTGQCLLLIRLHYSAAVGSAAGEAGTQGGTTPRLDSDPDPCFYCVYGG